MSGQFRPLRADEIDVRIAMVKQNGCQLLLYKDARCDMSILDETVGASNWQRRHYECKGNLFCEVSIRECDEWVSKSDCGAESYTEKEKGEASDSFKRACVNWGIGRELYTSPFIWVSKCSLEQRGGKTVCNDRFKVGKIEYKDDRIVGLTILRQYREGYTTKEEIAFSFGTVAEKPRNEYKPTPATEKPKQNKAEQKKASDKMFDTAQKMGFSITEIATLCNVKYKVTPDNMSAEQCADMANIFAKESGILRDYLERMHPSRGVQYA